jgi:hypothetical protein
MYSVSAVPIKPVRVHIDGVLHDRYAATVEDLMGMLMSDNWPKTSSDLLWRRALSSCMSSITTQGDAAIARKAFVEAAHHAAVRVLPDDDLIVKARKKPHQRSQAQPTDLPAPRH